MSDFDWGRYLSSFHSERPGITEAVLDHARDVAGQTPGRQYVGLDLSLAELRVAAAESLSAAQADSMRLPLRASSVDAVVMSMALMLVPLAETLSEVKRVLRPAGIFVATTPHNRPMPARDWLRYARLCLALRHTGLSYPNDGPLAGARGAFAAADLALVEDEERAFACRMATPEVADQLLASLYVPEVAPERMEAGRKVVRRWAGADVTPRSVASSPSPEIGC